MLHTPNQQKRFYYGLSVFITGFGFQSTFCQILERAFPSEHQNHNIDVKTVTAAGGLPASQFCMIAAALH
jgi:hypothetical protein